MPVRAQPDFYAACYCEENVWRLLRDPRLEGADAYALFISNAARSFAMWKQRTAEPPDDPVIWDYHVVAIARRAHWEAWDLDSQLELPDEAIHYLRDSFPLPEVVPVELQPRFRLVPRVDFHARFASDRSHMRDEQGAWRAAPPADPAIRTAAETMNLWQWVDTEHAFVGEVFDLPALVERLGGRIS